MKPRIIKRTHTELAPEDIFIDSSNLPGFEKGRLEGRIERPIEYTTLLVLGAVIGLLFLVYIVQAGNLQVVQGEKFAAQSERNRLRPILLFPNRGALLDRNGEVLVSNERREDGSLIRTYKHPGFAHVLGYVSLPKKDSRGNYYETESEGKAGAELAFGSALSGTPGSILVEEDAKQNIVSEGSFIPPQDGMPLTLSLDMHVQDTLAQAIRETTERIGFTGGAGVIMDVATGEVVALASYPEYDPNVLVKAEDTQLIEGYAHDARRVYLNRAVSGLYTPGSIVKPIVAIAALSEGIIGEWTTIVSEGRLIVPNPYDKSKPTIFNDWKVHGATDMRRAIAVSSDVYFYQVGGGFESQKGLGIDALKAWFEKFGYTTKTNIELSGEEEGFIPSIAWKEETFDEPWRVGDTYNTSIGQYAMQITPLEAVRATAAIANGGVLVTPTLLYQGQTQGQTLDVDHYALQVAREGMHDVVHKEYGSAKVLNLPFVDIAAKTGTAQIGTEKKYVNNWVTGFWPYENPQYAFVVVMEKGPQEGTVGASAVLRQALTSLYELKPEFFNSAPVASE